MSGWYIGKPDAIYEMDEEFVVPANQELDMQYFIIDPKFTEDKWVQAVEIVPGDRSVVHHATLFVQEPGKMEVRPRNNQFPGLVTMPDWEFKPSSGPYKGTAIEQKLGVVEARTHESLASLGHGAPAEAWPEGTAKFIPAGSKLVLQVHYHSNGKEAKDRSKVGFIFAKQPPERRLYYLGVLNMNFTVPANNPDYEVKAEATLLKDIHIWSFAPHMHLRGKDMKYTLVYPDGKTEVLAFIDKYDFNMQRSYRLVEPQGRAQGQHHQSHRALR